MMNVDRAAIKLRTLQFRELANRFMFSMQNCGRTLQVLHKTEDLLGQSKFDCVTIYGYEEVKPTYAMPSPGEPFLYTSYGWIRYRDLFFKLDRSPLSMDEIREAFAK